MHRTGETERLRGMEEENGGGWREREKTPPDDRDANSFCSLPRLLRPFLRMQIVGGRPRGMRCSSRRGELGSRLKGLARSTKRSFFRSFTIQNDDV